MKRFNRKEHSGNAGVHDRSTVVVTSLVLVVFVFCVMGTAEIAVAQVRGEGDGPVNFPVQADKGTPDSAFPSLSRCAVLQRRSGQRT